MSVICIPVSTGIREGPFLSRPNGRQLAADLCKRRGGKNTLSEGGQQHSEAQASREFLKQLMEKHVISQVAAGYSWAALVHKDRASGWGEASQGISQMV